MAKKVETNKDIDEIKKALETDKIVMGTERAVKELKRGSLVKVFLSSNCPADVSEDIRYYASLNKTEIVDLSVPNDELGIVCKKPFAVSVLGLLKK